MKRNHISASVSILALITSSILIFTSCKKKPEPTDPTQKTALSDADSLKYLMYHLMQTTIVNGGRDTETHFPLYYWYENVPSMDPLSTEFSDAGTLLTRMMSYTKDNNGRVLDRYSFLDDGSVVDEISGEGGDMGFDITPVRSDKDNSLHLYVIWVDKNSPAGIAGVLRGWEIDQINGTKVVNENGDFNVDLIINAIYGHDNQATFSFVDLNGDPQQKQLAKATYNIDPILFDSVYTVNDKKVGYMVFNSFTAIANRNGTATPTKNEIDQVFTKFSSENISSLILDLRYNGGGDVNTAEYLMNKIAPASLADKEMYHYEYNDLLAAELEDEGEDNMVYFDGSGNLNLQHLFVIGSRSTASASELTFNNLRAYLDAYLVGDTTYGKPVGQWVQPIQIFKSRQQQLLAYLIAITFETRNANNEGGYFQGINPDQEAVDFVDVPWGSSEDDNLEKIFSFIKTGAFSRRSLQERLIANPGLKVASPSLLSGLPKLRYNGMVSESKLKKMR